jgi:hypothetical protein
MNKIYENHRSDLAEIIISKAKNLPQKQDIPMILTYFIGSNFKRISLALVLIMSFFFGFQGSDFEIENQQTVFEEIYNNNFGVL